MRRERSDIYRSILSYLQQEVGNAHKIAAATAINWETTKKSLQLLEELGLVTSEKEGERKVYSLKKHLQREEDTLLGLPLDKNTRKELLSLFHHIQQRWKTLTKRAVSRTFLQKMVVALIKRKKLNLPYGWYLFGECTLLVYQEDMTGNTTTEYQEAIDKIVSEFNTYQTKDDLLRSLYKKEKKELYLTRLGMLNELNAETTEDSMRGIKHQATRLAITFPSTKINKETTEAVEGFTSIVGRIINANTPSVFNDIKQEVIETFNSLWELIATYTLYESLLEQKYFSQPLLDEHYQNEVENLLKIVIAKLDNLAGYCPELVPQDEPFRKFIGAREG